MDRSLEFFSLVIVSRMEILTMVEYLTDRPGRRPALEEFRCEA